MSTNAINYYVALGPYVHRVSAHPAAPYVAEDRRAGFVPGAYLPETDYRPDGLDYAPPENENSFAATPNSLGGASDGLEALNPTYRSHAVNIAEHMTNMLRSATMWENQTFGPNWRNLVGPQRARVQGLYNAIATARPVMGSDVFFGYRINPANVGNYPAGQTPLGG